jgi:protein CpxP
MKRVLLSASLALALSGTLVFAQSTTATTPAPAGKHHRHHPKDPQQQAAWLSKKLNLSPDQTAKVEPILADSSQKMAALHSNTSISHEQWKQQAQTIHESTKQQLAAVLTPEQLQQMKSMHHHRFHGAPNQNQPQTQTAPPAGL